MSLFGLSGRKLGIYAAMVVLLLGLNIWQFAPHPPAFTERDAEEAPIALELPELSGFDLQGNDAGPVRRDLFRPDATLEEPPVEVEEPDAVTPPPPDPRALALSEANKKLDEVALIGLMSGGEGMVAVVEINGKVDSVQVGDELLPGFVVGRISLDGLVVSNDSLGITRDVQIGTNGGN